VAVDGDVGLERRQQPLGERRGRLRLLPRRRDDSEFIAADAWFCAIGLVAGLLIGLAAWRWLRTLGWSVVLVVLVCATAAALTCWLVGYRLGPGDFSARLAAAQPGELVAIPLTLRARASLLTWPFFAVIPVLLGSSLGRDDEEPRPLFRRRGRSGEQPQ